MQRITVYMLGLISAFTEIMVNECDSSDLVSGNKSLLKTVVATTYVPHHYYSYSA